MTEATLAALFFLGELPATRGSNTSMTRLSTALLGLSRRLHLAHLALYKDWLPLPASVSPPHQLSFSLSSLRYITRVRSPVLWMTKMRQSMLFPCLSMLQPSETANTWLMEALQVALDIDWSITTTPHLIPISKRMDLSRNPITFQLSWPELNLLSMFSNSPLLIRSSSLP